VDIEYQKGPKLTNSLNTDIDPDNYNFTTDEMHYKALTLSPHVIFKALAKPKYFVYNKLGILVSFPYTLFTSGNSGYASGYAWPPGAADSAVASLTVENKSYEGKYKISTGIGFNVAFGINMRLNSNLRVFAELFGNFSALSPSSSEVSSVDDLKYSAFSGNYDYSTEPPTFTNYVLSGYHQINHLSEHTAYHKGGPTGRVQDSFVWDPGDPNTYTVYHGTDKRFIVNMNAIGINCGITYRF